MVSLDHAIHGFVVSVSGLCVMLADEFAKRIKDPQVKLTVERMAAPL
jgi:hypothetical protein